MESHIEILSSASLLVRTVKPCVLSMMTEFRIPCGGFLRLSTSLFPQFQFSSSEELFRLYVLASVSVMNAHAERDCVLRYDSIKERSVFASQSEN